MPAFYDNIIDLPLSKYIEVAVKGNIYALVIEPEPAPDPSELTRAWNIIQQEYADAMGDMETLMYIKLLKETGLLKLDYEYVELCIKTLTKFLEMDHSLIVHILPELNEGYFMSFANDINEFLKTNFKFDYTDKKQCLADLKRCTNRNKGIKMRWELKQMELETLQKKYEDKATKPTVEYFLNMLITLSDEAGIRLDTNITVYEFCERVRRYTKLMKA